MSMVRVVLLVPLLGCVADTLGQTGGQLITGATDAVTEAATDTPGGTSDAPTTGVPATCGDGAVQDPEECDDGNQVETDICTNACTTARCGDGIVGPGEMCDAAGFSSGCNDDCTESQCGDARLNPEAGEACDDGDMKGGACSPTCALNKITDISLGVYHTCIVIEGGILRCWGSNNKGALGAGHLNTIGDEPGEMPATDVNIGGAADRAAAGDTFMCVLLGNGSVRCWGYAQEGRLGYGDLQDLGADPNQMPTPEVDVGILVRGIATGDSHTCVWTTDDRVRCWGWSASLGIMADENVGDQPGEMPPIDIPGLAGVTAIAAGGYSSCALAGDGGLWCWDYAASQPNVGGEVKQVAIGSGHQCVLLKSGDVRCWGNGDQGQLGYENPDHIQELELPTANLNLGGKASQIVAGRAHSCALMETGKVKCWGSGMSGALGSGEKLNIGDSPEEMPPPDVALGGEVILLAAHASLHTCAVLADFSLRCWGENNSGQLGYGHNEPIGDDELPESAGPVPF